MIGINIAIRLNHDRRKKMSTTSQPVCKIVRQDSTFKGKQALTYVNGITAESVGATGICMHLLTMPPGARANAHLHEAHETAIYVLEGEAGMWYGENLREHLLVKKGEYHNIPPAKPHLPYKASDTPYTHELARTHPNEQESVVPLPELDDLH